MKLMLLFVVQGVDCCLATKHRRVYNYSWRLPALQYLIDSEIKSGVYSINNTQNGRIYIGSSARLRKRFKMHVKQLEQNKHSNRFLQNDWNKCGSCNFTFKLLERVENCTKEELMLLEQRWINKFFDHTKNCYNMCCIASSTLGIRKTTKQIQELRKAVQKYRINFVIMSPDNIEYQANGIKDFADAHNLDHSALKRVIDRKQMVHKGWKLPENKECDFKAIRDAKIRARFAKTFDVVLLSPDNARYTNIVNLRSFCRQLGLSCPNIHAVICGKVPIHKGWRLLENKDYSTIEKRKEANRRKTKIFTTNILSPFGERITTIENIREFCRKNELDRSSLLRFLRGQGKTIKGWSRG